MNRTDISCRIGVILRFVDFVLKLVYDVSNQFLIYYDVGVKRYFAHHDTNGLMGRYLNEKADFKNGTWFYECIIVSNFT